jgi:hypothetical protein
MCGAGNSVGNNSRYADDERNARLTLLAKEALTGMKKYIAPYLATRVNDRIEILDAASEIEKHDLIVVPPYTFDTDYFYADPSAGRFTESLRENNDRIVFLALNGESGDFRLDAGKDGEQWSPVLYARGVGQDFPRLCEIVQDTNNRIYLLKIFFKEFYLVERDDAHVAYDTRGKEWSINDLCSYVVTIMNAVKENERHEKETGERRTLIL